MTRLLFLIAIDIGRALGERSNAGVNTNLDALLRLGTITDVYEGKTGAAWVARTISSLTRRHRRNVEIQRYVAELNAALEEERK